MLDEFSSANISGSKATAHSAPTTAPPQPAPISAPSEPTTQQDSADDDDFAKELQAGMATLLGQLDSDPDMQKQFENMMKELGAAASTTDSDVPTSRAGPSATSTAASGAAPSGTKKPAEASFQDTIRKTMERMQTSGDTASAAATGAGEEDILAQMLREMESGGFGGGSEDDMNKMLMGMMEQLTNKDILYEPMKELHDKFPAWFNNNKDKCPKEDLARYEEQQRVVDEIVARFERAEYSDESNEDREYIVERMQKVHSFAPPPANPILTLSRCKPLVPHLLTLWVT